MSDHTLTGLQPLWNGMYLKLPVAILASKEDEIKCWGGANSPERRRVGKKFWRSLLRGLGGSNSLSGRIGTNEAAPISPIRHLSRVEAMGSG